MTDYTDPDAEATPTPGNPEEDHPAQEAHGGSMAPGLVDDTGRQTADQPLPPPGDDQ